MENLLTVDNLLALLTLTALEIVLGIDNIVFIAILAGKLREEQRGAARQVGLMLAMVMRMGELARSQTRQCKQAFALRDVELAEDLVRQDAEINRLNRDCFQRAVAIGTDADRREWAMTMMLVARALERIGDNAVDVGEQVAFVVTGLFREFSDASHR